MTSAKAKRFNLLSTEVNANAVIHGFPQTTRPCGENNTIYSFIQKGRDKQTKKERDRQREKTKIMTSWQLAYLHSIDSILHLLCHLHKLLSNIHVAVLTEWHESGPRWCYVSTWKVYSSAKRIKTKWQQLDYSISNSLIPQVFKHCPASQVHLILASWKSAYASLS